MYFLCSTKVGTWYSMAKIHNLWQILLGLQKWCASVMAIFYGKKKCVLAQFKSGQNMSSNLVLKFCQEGVILEQERILWQTKKKTSGIQNRCQNWIWSSQFWEIQAGNRCSYLCWIEEVLIFSRKFLLLGHSTKYTHKTKFSGTKNCRAEKKPAYSPCRFFNIRFIPSL